MKAKDWEDNALDEAIRSGWVEEVGVNEDGDMLLRLTVAGKLRVGELLDASHADGLHDRPIPGCVMCTPGVDGRCKACAALWPSGQRVCPCQTRTNQEASS